MVATIKSEFNPNLGLSVFNNHAQLTDEEYERLKSDCEDYEAFHIFVTTAATDPLMLELDEFVRDYQGAKERGSDYDSEENENIGAGRYPSPMLLTILILKEHEHLSFDLLARRVRYDLSFRYALGIDDIHCSAPSESKIKTFVQAVKLFNESKSLELGRSYSIFNEVLKNIGISTVNYFGKDKYTGILRLDSTLAGSKIAHHSRPEIIISVLKDYLAGLSFEQSESLTLRTTEEWPLIMDILGIGGKKMSYEMSDSGEAVMRYLGFALSSILDDVKKGIISETAEFPLLERVYMDQFNEKTGGPVLKPGKEIKADSLQNVNDPDASYANKYGPVQGEVVNASEIIAKRETVTDEDGNEISRPMAPHVLTGIQVETAATGDTEFIDESVESAQEIGNACGHAITGVLGDGGYASLEKSQELKEKGINLMTTELKGKESAFEYKLQDDGTLLVTDRRNPEITYVAIPANTKNGSRKWKFTFTDQDGKEKARYITEDALKHQEIREKQKALPSEIKKGRNNVEATMKEVKSGWYKGKIRYRRKIRILTALSAKAVGIQIRRIINFCKKYGEDLPKLCQNWG